MKNYILLKLTSLSGFRRKRKTSVFPKQQITTHPDSTTTFQHLCRITLSFELLVHESNSPSYKFEGCVNPNTEQVVAI